jgi:predicted amidohydrolase YtcJ
MEERKRPRMRSAVVAALAAALAAGLLVATGAYSGWGNGGGAVRKAAPDLILYNGKISTVDADNSTVQAVAIRDGEIIATGRSGRVRSLAKRSTERVNLRGRRVLPGLIDATLHGIRTGYHCFSRTVALDTIYSRSEALAEFARVAARTPDGAWVFTTLGSFQVGQLDVPGMFSRAELDAVAPDNPVRVSGSGFTGTQVNTKALETLGLAAGDPGVVVDGSGRPTGQLTGPAASAVNRAIGTELQRLSTGEQAECLEEFMRELNRRGLTAWDDPGGNDPFDPAGTGITVLRDNHGYQAVNRLHREDRMTTRISFNLSCFGPDAEHAEGMPGEEPHGAIECVERHTFNALGLIGDDMLRLRGIGEDVMETTETPDGPIYADPEYATILEHLARNDWPLEHHATAPSTQRAMVASWERVNSTIRPIADLRWFMLHPGSGPANPTQEIFDRLRALGAGIVLTDSGVRGGASHPPYRRAYESGTETCLGTDALNASPYPPFLNMWYTISGKTQLPGQPGVVPEQRLTRMQALEMATRKCGWFMDLEEEIGSLEVGKRADLIVLDRDYFKVPVDDIRTLTSVLTVVDGEIVYADGRFAGLDG